MRPGPAGLSRSSSAAYPGLGANVAYQQFLGNVDFAQIPTAMGDMLGAMAVAMGEEKVDAVLGALRTGALDVLVTEVRKITDEAAP